MKVWGQGEVVDHDDLNGNFSEIFGIGDLRRYGWKGDGVTDDTPAFNLAYAAISTFGGQITIPYSPSGTKLGNITLTKPVYIYAEPGINSFGRVIAPNPTATIFTVASGFVTIDGIEFYPSGPKQTGGAYIEIKTEGGFFRANRCQMIEFYCGFYQSGAPSGTTITECRAFLYSTTANKSKAWLHVQGGGIAVRVSGCLVAGPDRTENVCDSGILVENAGDVSITDGTQLLSCGTCLKVIPTAGQSVGSLWASETFFDTAARGVGLLPTGGGTIVRSKFDGCWFGSMTQQGFYANSPYCDGVQLNGCEFVLNDGDGALINGAMNVSFNGGRAAGNVGAGIEIGANTNNFSIQGMIIGAGWGFPANGNHGILVNAGTSTSWSIIGNTFTTNTGGAILDGSPGNGQRHSNIGDPETVLLYRDTPTALTIIEASQPTFGGFVFRVAGVPLMKLASDGTFSIRYAGGLKDVNIGAADSGGAGWRVMRIPN